MKINERLVKEFTERGLTIATAESCTGGLISKLITDVSGASAVFKGGACTYSNEAKTCVLGVDPRKIKAHGAVSAETAIEMALGAQEHMCSDMALAVTGIAGPKSDGTNKPVGLIYIAAISPWGQVAVKRLDLDGDRDQIRNVTAICAMEMALKLMRKTRAR